jgi:Cyclin, N-terminal domain
MRTSVWTDRIRPPARRNSVTSHEDVISNDNAVLNPLDLSSTRPRKRQESRVTRATISTRRQNVATATRTENSSDDSTITIFSTRYTHKRQALAVTNENIICATKKKSRTSTSSDSYSLRPRQPKTRGASTDEDSANTAAASTKPTATVTPAGVVRQINFDPLTRNSCLYNQRSCLPRGVVDIFSKTAHISNGLRCRCPMHLCQSPSMHEPALDLGTCYMNDYGMELDSLLREQESKEQIELLPLLSMKQKSLSSLSSTTSSSSESIDTLRTDDDSNGDEESAIWSDDDDSTPSTPRPGTVLKYSLKGLTPSSSMPLVPSISDTEPIHRQPFITPKMRNILVNWLSEVALEYRVSDEALHLSISILDAVLSKGPRSTSNPHHTEYEIIDNHSESDSDKENNEPSYFIVHRKDFQALGW